MSKIVLIPNNEVIHMKGVPIKKGKHSTDCLFEDRADIDSDDCACWDDCWDDGDDDE